jgi:hypothetical protein
VQIEAIASGVNQVIEAAKVCKEGLHGPLVRNINRVPLNFSADGFNGFLNSFRVA